MDISNERAINNSVVIFIVNFLDKGGGRQTTHLLILDSLISQIEVGHQGSQSSTLNIWKI